MIPELAQLSLALAFCIALLQGIGGIAGAARADAAWMGVTRGAAQAQALLIALAFGCLTYSFATSDFSVAYVAANSNSALPMAYKLAGVWGGHEGSLLLWILMLGGWMFAVTLFSGDLPEDMAARVLGVMGLVSAGFLAFMLFTSNPFQRLLPAAADGRDLNPLLQDPGMVFHPPMLYMGYVGFSVAFSFAVAALLAGRLDATWARWSRPWTTVAWAFLTLGIALGGAWAYYELGWGGWWFWDPVENASFMPWLAGTALMHSLAVTEKRGAFKSWTVLLAIVTFALSLVGTFIVRSGVLTSVHAFATDPLRGVFILGLFALVIGTSLVLYSWRTARVGAGGSFGLVSRESMLLSNNVLLAAACGAVLLGTLYPLALDALDLGKISVGPPYFDAVFVPMMAPALFLMGLGPLARWKSAALPELAVRVRWALGVSLLAALVSPFILGRWSPMVSLGLFLAFWIVASSVVHFTDRVRNGAPGLQMWRRLRQTPRAYYGMLIAHLGVAVFVIGVTLVKGYESEKDVVMKPGDSVSVGGYEFRMQSVQPIRGPNYASMQATLEVLQDSKLITTLQPEKRLYIVQQMPTTEAAIDAGVLRDLYVSLGDQVEGGGWLMRVQHKPFVDWIWGGCLLMALGGLLAAFDRRYRASLARSPARVSSKLKQAADARS